MFDQNDVQQNKAIVIISLVFSSPLFFLPLIACPQSEYGRFYANQGLLLFLAEIVAGVIAAIIPIIGGLCPLAAFVLWVMTIVAAAQGQRKEMPLIGGIQIIK